MVSGEPDLIRLNLRAPIVDAVCATVCSSWSDATDLWFEVHGEPRYRDLAVQCGLQAALNAGLLDMAAFFEIGLADLPSTPEFLETLVRKNQPVRSARAAFYDKGIQSGANPLTTAPGRELMRLHLFREAICAFLASREFQKKPAETVPLLARAYSMLGLHATLSGLNRTYGAYLKSSDSVALVERAERLLKREADAPLKNVMRFQQQHPLGAVLAAAIERWGGHSLSEL